jgi:hypothetical protein
VNASNNQQNMGRRKQEHPGRDLGPVERRSHSHIVSGGLAWNQLTTETIIKEEEAEQKRSSKYVPEEMNWPMTTADTRRLPAWWQSSKNIVSEDILSCKCSSHKGIVTRTLLCCGVLARFVVDQHYTLDPWQRAVIYSCLWYQSSTLFVFPKQL